MLAEESTHDVEQSLDALLQVHSHASLTLVTFAIARCSRQMEESKAKAAQADLAAAKQRMLNIEKAKIRLAACS